MPADLRILRLADGRQVQTPLLVPSFSSKGFGLVGGHPPRSEVSPLLSVVIDQLSRSFLMSAYDLHHRLFHAADSLGDTWSASPLSKTEVLFIDSGGYEATQSTDADELVKDLSEPREWTPEILGELLDRFPDTANNIAAVAWDLPGAAYVTQVEKAQDFLGARPRLAPVVLLKPEDRQVHNFTQLEAVAPRLSFFSVIGVTERELADTLIGRVVAIIRLRDLLNRAGLNDRPIHVFGALDPLYVPLYFAAGADIFDGLTWLRYAYWHGLAVHVEHGPLLQGQGGLRDDVRRYATAAANLTQLGQLRHNLLRFVSEKENWSVFNDTMIGRPGEQSSDILSATYRSAVAEKSR